MNRIILLFFLSVLTFAACQKENLDQTTVDVTPNTPSIIHMTSGDVLGRVIDESNIPVANAEVQLGNQFTLTNDFGLFLFEDATLNSQGTYVTVQKEGYFHGSRTFVPASTTSQQVVVQLLQKTETQTFNSQNATTVQVEQGTSIEFVGNSIVDAAGNTYNGNVRVFAKRLDPLAENLADIMPGNLTGIAESGARVALASYGMLAVELESPSGEALQIAPNQTATITYSVPQALQANAPTSIPLWHFDEIEGIWKEESVATLQGDSYVGAVSHFSMWNWDIPYDKLINLSGKVINKTLAGIEGLSASIYLVNKGAGGFTITDTDGNFAASVPAGEMYDITVYYEGACNEPIVFYEAQVGPFDDDTGLADILVDVDNVQNIESTFEVSGTVVDCDGNPVWGLVDIENEQGQFIQSAITDANGAFDAVVISCHPVNEVHANVINLNTLESVDVTESFADEVDFSTITTCNGAGNIDFLFAYEAADIYNTENNTTYRDARIEYIECANKYYFEITSTQSLGGMETPISSILIESNQAFVEGQSYTGDVFLNVMGGDFQNIEATITFTKLTSEEVSGTFIMSHDNSEGTFASELN